MDAKLALSAAPSVWERIEQLRQRDTELLAPNVQHALRAGLTELEGATIIAEDVQIPLDVFVFETLRSDELQRIYYEQGTTNAPTAIWSWHFYGLGFDVISRRFEWFGNVDARRTWPDPFAREAASRAWFGAVARVFERHGLAWGGHWSKPDLPHFQWARCAVSPVRAPDIYRRAGGGLLGREAVWHAVGAA
jgi:hypothetical protein